MSDKIKIVCVVGPTASGKTSIGIMLAKKLNGEIVSADSMQIYRELSVSTAKPTAEEMGDVKHHLIDIKHINEEYSVAQYVRDAKECIKNISSNLKLPIIVGGTGLYINSLIDNIEFFETKRNLSRREELLKIAEDKGNRFLLNYLSGFDPETASRLHENDIKRVIRAIEVYETSGVTISEQNRLSKLKESEFDVCMVGLNYRNREVLYDKINKRVDQMLENGLVSEAKLFYDNKKEDTTSCQAIGVKELFPYFENKITLDEAVENIKTETRRYAKRQLSWFLRDERITWFYMDEPEKEKKILNFVKKDIGNFW